MKVCGVVVRSTWPPGRVFKINERITLYHFGGDRTLSGEIDEFEDMACSTRYDLFN
jgi:hypothetical protein